MTMMFACEEVDSDVVTGGRLTVMSRGRSTLMWSRRAVDNDGFQQRCMASLCCG